jgi:hypothetical protein
VRADVALSTPTEQLLAEIWLLRTVRDLNCEDRGERLFPSNGLHKVSTTVPTRLSRCLSFDPKSKWVKELTHNCLEV